MERVSQSPEHRAPKSPIRFGTDGWRAVMAEEFTFANVRKVAWALGHWMQKNAPGKAVFVGYDRRFASREFAEEAASVTAGAGIETRLANDILPTPAFSYLAKKSKAYALIVTASHNPPTHNGLKIKTPDGASAPVRMTKEIEFLTLQAPEELPKTRCLADGTLRREYVSYLRQMAVRVRSKLRGKKIAVDYLHGSGAGFLEEALGERSIVARRKERDPEFGGIAPEPIEKNMGELKTLVKKSKALLGVALDGDGDRVSLVDDKGNYLAPTTVFPMYAYYLALHKKNRGEIVQGVSLGYLGERVARKAGLPFAWVPVGFKNIAERMVAGDVLLGGEESGGYALGRLLPDRDGSANALLMVELLLELGLKPSQLVERIFKEFGPSYYERFDLHLSETVQADAFREAAVSELLPGLESSGYRLKEKVMIDGLKAFFDNGSWLLLRPSGTEPLVRIYAESATKKMTRELLGLASGWAKTKLSSK
ncbi:MAG: phosphoglucomutase/phosphomannomutase family protein [Elusimicrobia bacterium]|nr:phosphoglucomutase/phosphomannomutase family protein [Elusimicrobiota bacterium]